jgi:hypothetical protein
MSLSEIVDNSKTDKNTMNCCICGTVRNCDIYLDKIFQNMELIGSLFENYIIILYYDHSDDNTLIKLKNYKEMNKKLTFYVNKSPLLPYRTHRLALGRNYCIDYIKKNYPNYPYFIMMDCDDRCALNININNLKKHLYEDTWDALTFQHPSGYYDTWALSKRPFVVSCHNFKDPFKGEKLITTLINNTPKDKLIPCFSAFNGFCIYRTQKFINCHYDGRFRLDYIPNELIRENIKYAGPINLSQNKEDCEHRCFHFEAVLKNNARIRISPLCLFV